MPPARSSRVRYLRVALGAILLATAIATLVQQESRVALWLAVRTVLHLPAKGTTVLGNTRGCVVRQVPQVFLADDRSLAIEEEARSSADAYAVLLSTPSPPRIRPSPESWRSSSSAVWGALHEAALLEATDEDFGARASSLATLLRELQGRHPTNGALWFAQGRLEALRADWPAAERALQAAAARPLWRADAAAMRRSVSLRLRGEGIPELEAVEMAWSLSGAPLPSLISEASERFRALAEAGNTEGAERLLRTLAGLQTASWTDSVAPRRTPSAGLSSVLESEPSVVAFRQSLSPAGTLKAARAALEARWDQEWDSWRARGFLSLPFEVRRTVSLVSLCCLGLLLLWSLLDVPFALLSNWRGSRFLFAVLLFGAGGGLVLWSALDATNQPSGLRLVAPAMGPATENILLTVVVVLGALGIRLWGLRRGLRTAFPDTRLLVAAVLVLGLFLCLGHLRSEELDLLRAR